jgi:hypothetical protein
MDFYWVVYHTMYFTLLFHVTLSETILFVHWTTKNFPCTKIDSKCRGGMKKMFHTLANNRLCNTYVCFRNYR